jgi:hypothetical protein
MSGLRRMLDEGGTEAELALIRAGHTVRMADEGAKARVLAAMTAATAGTAIVATASGAKGGAALLASRILSHAWVKWIGAIALGGSVGATTLVYMQQLKGTRKGPVTEAEARRPSGVLPEATATTVPTNASETVSATPVVGDQPETRVATPNIEPTAMPKASRAEETSPPPEVVRAPASRSEAQKAPLGAQPRLTVAEPATKVALDRDSARSAPVESQPERQADTHAAERLTTPSSPGGASSPPTPVVAPPETSTVGTEIAMLDHVRASLAQADAEGSRRALDQYDRAFPRGVFQEEARVLRIETVLRAGDRPRAESLAKDFLRTNPSGPYAKRLRALLQ